MCGIAGVVVWDEKQRITRDQLQHMSRGIAHRGPDGEGLLLTEDSPQVGFAFRRLAVLDPDPRAMQPFSIGPLTMVFNGEIYNYRELRAELSKLQPDYQWRTTGDAEVLLLGFAQWREECLEKLNGMFALAIWDASRGELFLARDRMGQKPLYVCESAGAIAFASEIAALRPLPWIDWTAQPAGLGQYLCYGYTDRFFAGCRQLPPGSFRLHRSEARSYFDPAGQPDDTPRDAANARRLVSTAVERQLVSDVPLGVFLSGGIDSSVIALAARQRGAVKTFSIAFDDPRYDESEFARAVAKHLGTEHHEFRVSPSVVEDLPKLARVFGEPFADSSALPTHYLARETRRHVTVALSGDGGDELFGGYDRYRAMQLGSLLRPLGLLAPLVRGRAAGDPKSRATRAARLIASLSLPDAKRYDAYMRLFDDAALKSLLSDQSAADGCGTVDQVFTSLTAGRDLVAAACATDRLTYLPGDLLAKVDRCSMLHGLEVRSPFMDHELVNFASGLDRQQLVGGGAKRLLREAFARDLPDFVFKRRKMGFAVPIGQWLRNELRSMLHDHLFAADSFASVHFNKPALQRLIDEHQEQRRDHAQRLYALLMLELWHSQQLGK